MLGAYTSKIIFTECCAFAYYLYANVPHTESVDMYENIFTRNDL
jgi:hypothetical protein